MLTKSQTSEVYRSMLRAAPPPDWVLEMHEHYRQTGTFRAEDLRRLLGDQRRGVRVGPNTTWESFLGRV